LAQGPINITEPVGSINDPNSKISPFKIMAGVQAVDAEYEYLLVPHLFPRDKEDKTAYWKHRDWQKSFADGMKAAGMKYSGKYEWIPPPRCTGGWSMKSCRPIWPYPVCSATTA
jgi:hypothetical protein